MSDMGQNLIYWQRHVEASPPMWMAQAPEAWKQPWRLVKEMDLLELPWQVLKEEVKGQKAGSVRRTTVWTQTW